MKQPVKGEGRVKVKKTTQHRKGPFAHRNHKQKYGTSKLELDFARDFLDKMGLVYIYEYEAKDIKRFFDFAVTSHDDVEYIMESKDGLTCVRQDKQLFVVSFMIEIDGGYYHGDPRVVDTNKLNPMQKHNKFVDRLKDEWCGAHCVPLLRIWEYDIRNNPQKVMDMIKYYAGEGKKKKKMIESRKRPH